MRNLNLTARYSSLADSSALDDTGVLWFTVVDVLAL